MRSSVRVAGSLSMVALLAACGGSSKSNGPPVTPQAVSTNAVAVTTPVVRQLVDSLGAIGTNTQVQELLARLGLGAGTGTYQLRSGIAVRQSAMVSGPRTGAIARAATWLRQQVETPTAGDAAAQQLEDFLRNKVFTEANLESSDSASATFLLRGSVVCPDPNATAEEVAACTQQLDAIQLRIRAIPHAETAIDLELMVGPQRAIPVKLALANTPSIAVTVDLAAAKSSVASIGAALGTPVQTLPTVMEGVITFAMKVENQTKLTLESSISQDVRLQVVGATAAESVSLTVGRVTSLAKLVADDVAKTVELSGALANVAIAAPEQEQVWSDTLQTYTTVVHAMEVGLASASGSLLLRPDDTGRATFDLDGLVAKRDGAVLLAASLANPCVAELAATGIDFTSPLAATFSARDDANVLVDYTVNASGPFLPHDVCDSTTGICTSYLELLTGATFDLTAGTTQVHGTPGQCVDLGAGTVGQCPALPL